MTSISYKWCRTLELDSETFITTREGGEFKSRDCVVGFWLVVVEECVYVCVCVREREGGREEEERKKEDHIN